MRGGGSGAESQANKQGEGKENAGGKESDVRLPPQWSGPNKKQTHTHIMLS